MLQHFITKFELDNVCPHFDVTLHFEEVMESLFSDGITNFGRILAVFSLTKNEVDSLLEKKEDEKAWILVRKLEVLLFFEKGIEKLGGWHGFLDHFSRSRSSWSKVFVMGALSAGLLLLLKISHKPTYDIVTL